MTTIHSPINDKFETVLTDLVSNIVDSWDLKTCIAFCQEQMEQDWKSFSLPELVEQYELHHQDSIVNEVIDWTDYLGNEPDWKKFSRAEYYPVKMSGVSGVSGSTEIIRILEDNDKPDFYSVYLVDHAGMSQCILDLANEVEARVLADSINTHYLDQNSDATE